MEIHFKSFKCVYIFHSTESQDSSYAKMTSTLKKLRQLLLSIIFTQSNGESKGTGVQCKLERFLIETVEILSKRMVVKHKTW